jgi:protein-tyrosine kinase
MTRQDPLAPRASLLERAAEIYDFQAALGQRNALADGSAAAPEVAPPYGGRHGAVDRIALAEAGFILPDAPTGVLPEEFRIIKRQLLLAAFGGNTAPAVERGRIILVASAQPDEGKTFCAVNLALSIAAEKDVEVLLIDADFAKPEILSILGLEGGPGLVDALEDSIVDVESCIIRTDIPNLLVLPAGRQTNQANELIASDRTRDLLDQLVRRHPQRVLIFDSAPVLAASPASVLALHAGQVLMVVRADRTGEAELREALAMLSGCGSIQLLLNSVSFAPGARRFGEYYGTGE